MFNYVIEFTKIARLYEVDTIKAISSNPILSINHLSPLYDDFISGKTLQFFLKKYHRDTHKMTVQSLWDWGNTLPMIIEYDNNNDGKNDEGNE